DALLCLGRAYLEMGELKQALKYLRKAEKLAIEPDEHRDVSHLLGRTYWFMGKVEKALDYYEKQVYLSQFMADTEGTADALVALAEVCEGIGKQEKALELLHMALGIMPEEKAGNIYNSVAIIYSDMEDFEKALWYFLKSLEVSKKTKDQYGIAMCLLNIGSTYRELKRYDLAQQCLLSGLDEAYKLYERIGSKGDLQAIEEKIFDLDQDVN
ncbi:MAG: tetratricopeptide repeat protein, partial [Aquificaceae bacterium]